MSGTHSNDGCQREIHDNQFVNQIVEVLGQGVTVVSMEGRFEYVNPAYAAMVGRTTQELIGLRPQAVTHPDDWTKLAQALKQRQAGHTTTYETRLLRSDGSIVYAHITGSPRWQEGQVIGTFVIITDLTEQRQAEKALHESEERYRLLVHKIRDVVFQTDAAGCWTFLNQVWEEITGFAVADSLAQSVDGYVYPEDSERHRAEFAPLMEGRKTDCRYEMRLITQEGGHRWFEVDVRLLRNEAGEVVGTTGLLHDITQRKRVEMVEYEQRTLAEALQDTAAALTSTLDLDEVFDRILDKVGHVTSHTGASILSLKGTKAYSVRASGWLRAWLEATPTGQFQIDSSESGLLRRMIKICEPVIIPDTHDHLSWLEEHGLTWVHSFAAAPIRIEGTIAGFLILVSEKRDFFTPIHAHRLQTFADQAAIALKNAQLFRETRQLMAVERRHYQELEAVLHAGLSLLTSLDLDEVLTAILHSLFELFPIYSTNIFLYDNGKLTFGLGMMPDGLTNHPYAEPRRQGLTHQVIQSGQPIFVDDTETHPLFAQTREQWGRFSIAGLPLLIEAQVVGVLNVSYPDPHFFSDAEKQLMQLLATHAAIAIQNARLHEKAQLHAHELTQRVAERTTELEQERSRLQTILDAVSDAIYFADANKIIRYANPATEHITGYRAEEIKGKPGHLWRGPTNQAILENLEATIERGGHWQGEVINQRKDGTLYDASLSLSPLKDVQQRIIGYVGIQRDITNIKELARLRGQFVSRIGHELRTPLTNLQIYLDLLRRGQPEKQGQYLGLLHIAATRLRKLIEGFLEFSSLTAETYPVERQMVDVNEVLVPLLEELQPVMTARRLQLVFEPQPVLPLVATEPVLLSQLVFRLLENACDYTPPGGQITVMTYKKWEEEEEWLLIAVQDTGPGIKSQEIPHLFEQFFRGEAAADFTTPGAGLGLAISQQIIQKLGGRITVNSLPGEGATFMVWLPQLG